MADTATKSSIVVDFVSSITCLKTTLNVNKYYKLRNKKILLTTIWSSVALFKVGIKFYYLSN